MRKCQIPSCPKDVYRLNIANDRKYELPGREEEQGYIMQWYAGQWGSIPWLTLPLKLSTILSELRADPPSIHNRFDSLFSYNGKTTQTASYN